MLLVRPHEMLLMDTSVDCSAHAGSAPGDGFEIVDEMEVKKRKFDADEDARIAGELAESLKGAYIVYIRNVLYDYRIFYIFLLFPCMSIYYGYLGYIFIYFHLCHVCHVFYRSSIKFNQSRSNSIKSFQLNLIQFE